MKAAKDGREIELSETEIAEIEEWRSRCKPFVFPPAEDKKQ